MDNLLWHRVEDHYAELEANAPEGHVPVVTVIFAGGVDRIDVEFIVIVKDDPWVFFQARNWSRPAGDVKPEKEDRLVMIHESFIVGVELTYRKPDREGQQFGFSVDERLDQTKTA